jgi:hypothetical protein
MEWFNIFIFGHATDSVTQKCCNLQRKIILVHVLEGCTPFSSICQSNAFSFLIVGILLY